MANISEIVEKVSTILENYDEEKGSYIKFKIMENVSQSNTKSTFDIYCELSSMLIEDKGICVFHISIEAKHTYDSSEILVPIEKDKTKREALIKISNALYDYLSNAEFDD